MNMKKMVVTAFKLDTIIIILVIKTLLLLSPQIIILNLSSGHLSCHSRSPYKLQKHHVQKRTSEAFSIKTCWLLNAINKHPEWTLVQRMNHLRNELHFTLFYPPTGLLSKHRITHEHAHTICAYRALTHDSQQRKIQRITWLERICSSLAVLHCFNTSCQVSLHKPGRKTETLKEPRERKRLTTSNTRW